MAETLPEPITLPTERPNAYEPPAELLRLRDEGPIHRLAFPDGHVGWLATHHATARAVLADNRFSVRPDLRHFPIPHPNSARSGALPPGMFLRMDAPEHTRFRRLLTGLFTVRRMKQLEPRIREITADHLDEMERTGPPVDLVTAFALPIPSLVICELLGVPYTDRERFQSDSHQLVSAGTTKEKFDGAMSSLIGYLYQLVLAKRAEPGEDLLSGLVTSGDLTDEEVAGVAVLLLVAGHETTANMLALGTFTLLQHPEQLAALRADPSLIDTTVEELLRYLSIVNSFVTRTPLEDVELEGRTVRAGETVVIAMPAVNRDTEHFGDSDTLDITRSTHGHLAFGHGIHQCLGQQLARVEMRIGYTALFERFPNLRLAVPPEEVPSRVDMLVHGVHRLPVAW